MSNSRGHGPFKDSIERREFEKIQFHRRFSKESMEKSGKSYDSVSKHLDVIINHKIKKLMDAQAKINNRIQDIKYEQEIARWSSLPRIDEKTEVPCMDPYPITFQTSPAVSLPGGGKMYPVRSRKKSLEFEDVSLLTYETRPSPSPLRKAGHSAATQSQASHSTANGLAPHSPPTGKHSGKTTISPSKATLIQIFSGQKTSPTTPRAQKSHASPRITPKKHFANPEIKINPQPSPKLAQKKMNQCSPLLSRHQNGTRVLAESFTSTEKDIILRSPLSKRKLNSVVETKQNLLQLPDDFL